MKIYTHAGIKVIPVTTDAQSRQKDEESDRECTQFHHGESAVRPSSTQRADNFAPRADQNSGSVGLTQR